MAYRVAIIGDSAMWGQGLLRQNTYAFKVATALAAQTGSALEIVPGRGSATMEPERGEARSGAQLHVPVVSAPYRDRENPENIRRDLVRYAGQSTEFPQTFPAFFDTVSSKNAFVRGEDHTPARLLFGENPASFPTINDGIRHLAQSLAAGPSINLVLINGGINDVGIESVLSPSGPSIKNVLNLIRDVFTTRLDETLRLARAAFPSALIVMPGYFAALTERSNILDLIKFGKYMADKPEWQIDLNDALQFRLVSPVWNATFGTDPDEEAEAAVRRTVVAAAHAHFWARRTIQNLPRSIADPGILYAHPAFEKDHATFASDPHFYEHYKQPGEGGPEVDDEMLGKRMANIPRRELLESYWGLVRPYTEAHNTEVAALAARVDLPVGMTFLLKEARAGNNLDFTAWGKLVGAAQSEILRIERATIASMFHPNAKGAARYTDRIVKRVRMHERIGVRSLVGDGNGRLSLRAALTHHGLSGEHGIRQLAVFAPIQSVALQVRGLQRDPRERKPQESEPRVGPRGTREKSTVINIALGSDLTFVATVGISDQNLFKSFDVTDVPFAQLTGVELSIEGACSRCGEFAIFVNGADFFSTKGENGAGIEDSFKIDFAAERRSG